MIDKRTGAKSPPARERAEVDFNATYSFAGTPARRARVQGISAWTIRICAAEQLTLRRFIIVDVELPSGWVRIPGTVLILSGQSGNLFSYEIKVEEELLRSKFGSIESHRRREERRPAMRVVVDIAAAYTCNGRSFDGARISEIATSGLRLRTSEPLFVRSMIEIEIPVEGGRRARITGQVVRATDHAGDTFEYGVKLLSDAAEKDAIRKIVLAANVAVRAGRQ